MHFFIYWVMIHFYYVLIYVLGLKYHFFCIQQIRILVYNNKKCCDFKFEDDILLQTPIKRFKYDKSLSSGKKSNVKTLFIYKVFLNNFHKIIINF